MPEVLTLNNTLSRKVANKQAEIDDLAKEISETTNENKSWNLREQKIQLEDELTDLKLQLTAQDEREIDNFIFCLCK